MPNMGKTMNFLSKMNYYIKLMPNIGKTKNLQRKICPVVPGTANNKLAKYKT